MSQRTQQDRNMRHAPTVPQNKQERPIEDVSPNDDVGVKPDPTGQPAAPEKP